MAIRSGFKGFASRLSGTLSAALFNQLLLQEALHAG